MQQKNADKVAVVEEVGDHGLVPHESQDGLWMSALTKLRWYPKDMPHAEKKLRAEARPSNPCLRLSLVLHQVPRPVGHYQRLCLVSLV